jgi:hypothetical protein
VPNDYEEQKMKNPHVTRVDAKEGPDKGEIRQNISNFIKIERVP